MSTFPPQHVRVIASRDNGKHAHVLLNTGSEAHPYLYGVNCYRENGRWFEGSDGNAPGWSRNHGAVRNDDTDSVLGTLSFWREAPAGADMVKIAYDGGVIDVPVTSGAFLAVWFDVPWTRGWASVVSVRIDGQWR